MKVLMIGAHPDDIEFFSSGLASLYIKAGHDVRFLSVCDGSGGHQSENRNEIAARRYGETRKSAAILGVQYDVWNIPDCEIMADLPTRDRMVRYIRDYDPDIIFTHRPNDYHADHRNCGLLVQDASYLLIVPNYCPEAPAMREMPVIMFLEDEFSYPPFIAEVVVDIDSEIDTKFKMLDCHVSQMYEWLPYTEVYEDGTCQLDEVPDDPRARYDWMRGEEITAETPDSLILSKTIKGRNAEFARTAARFRKDLIERYGEKGNHVVYAEAFSLSEYGKQLTEESKKFFFPF